MKTGLVIFLILSVSILRAQEKAPEVLSLDEFLALVKEYHPVVKQANLHLKRGEAEVLKARGAFDPKIEVDYNHKKFKGTEYYEILNSTFKIPTWYGIELKAGFEQNEGVYLNPQNTVPEEGLFNAGVSVALGQDLLINERQATLRAAKAFQEQTSAERGLLVNQIMYQAAITYFEWLEAYDKFEVYQDFLDNSRNRFEGITKSAQTGEVAAIDTVEAKIVLQERKLELEKASRELMKNRFKVSGFIWFKNNVPVELQPHMKPDQDLPLYVDETLKLDNFPYDDILEEHFKLLSLEAKVNALEINRKLKLNQLLPKIDFEYNFITPEADDIMIYDNQNYKAGLNISFPLFLRKERGELKLAEYKLEEAKFEVDLNRRNITNKIETNLQEIESYNGQIRLVEELVSNYRLMVTAEERKFSYGESSLFLVNTRENKLIEARLKEIAIRSGFLGVKAELFRNLAITLE